MRAEGAKWVSTRAFSQFKASAFDFSRKLACWSAAWLPKVAGAEQSSVFSWVSFPSGGCELLPIPRETRFARACAHYHPKNTEDPRREVVGPKAIYVQDLATCRLVSTSNTDPYQLLSGRGCDQSPALLASTGTSSLCVAIVLWRQESLRPELALDYSLVVEPPRSVHLRRGSPDLASTSGTVPLVPRRAPVDCKRLRTAGASNRPVPSPRSPTLGGTAP